MADPEWDAATSLSDEDTARVLCAFHRTNSLQIQRHRSLQSQQKKQRTCHEPNHEMPQLHGLPTFGYPSNGMYHTMAISTQRDETASMLMVMNAPSTSSDDWHGQQRKQEIQTPRQHAEAQLWQQEETRKKQMQAQRIVERILQPRHSINTNELDRTRWSSEDHTSYATAPSLHNGDDQDISIHRRVQQSQKFRDAGDRGSKQLPVRTLTAPTPTQSYGSDYRGNLQVRTSMARNDKMFALQPHQTHVQTQTRENLAISAFQEWERTHGGIQSGMTKTSQMEAIQRRSQHQSLQPQPYYPTATSKRSRQAMSTPKQAKRSRSDDAFLNEIVGHFSTNSVSTFTAVRAQNRIRTGAETQIQRQPTTYSRLPVPPSGATVVPGVSLASQAVRLLTMRDILNGEDGSNKVDPSRNGLREGKQKRPLPPKRKISRKMTPVKRQKTSLQQSVQNIQQASMNQPMATLLPCRSANGVLVSASVPSARSCTPMRLAFVESRAVRVSKQAAYSGNTTPSVPASPSLLSAPIARLSTKFVNRKSAMSERRDPVSRKMAVVTSGMSDPSGTYQSGQQHSCTLTQSVAKLEGTSKDSQLTRLLQVRAAKAKRKTSGLNSRLTGQSDVSSVCDTSMDKALAYAEHIASSGATANDIQLAMEHDVVKIGQDTIMSKKKTRAKLPLARLIRRTARGQNQQKHVPSTENLARSIATSTLAATQAPVVSEVPRMENRTVVIFCKRDFMRYQAAKIWRKYQEQLKKHEEWREVRVAGKRTRYLNSRYDDEIQKTRRKTYTRSGRPPREALQRKNGTRRHKASLATADSSVRSTTLSCMPVNKEVEASISPSRDPGDVARSADSRSASKSCSLSRKRGVLDSDKSPMTRHASQQLDK